VKQTPYAFFYKHAGYSWSGTETRVQGKRRCAHMLADAEKAARDAGCSFEWSIDPYMDSSEWSDERPAWQVWDCLMRDASGRVVGSLGGIDFGRDGQPWGDSYKRVVEAELALEYTPE